MRASIEEGEQLTIAIAGDEHRHASNVFGDKRVGANQLAFPTNHVRAVTKEQLTLTSELHRVGKD